MSKPNIYILQKAYLKKNENGKLPGSFDIATTLGLIEYQKENEKKYMVIDSCQVVHWPKIKKAILKYAKSFDQVTHLLLTHTHMDHIQNIAEFAGKILFLANKTSIIGESEYGSPDIYPDGFIEIPEIQYEIVSNAHSHDDTIYIIDSENQGKVAFLGDLIYTRIEKMSISVVIKLEKRATVDPVKKFLYIKNFLEKHKDINKIFAAHDREPLTRDELAEYIKEFEESKEWVDYLKEYIKERKGELGEYEKELSF